MLDILQLHQQEDNRNAKQWIITKGLSLNLVIQRIIKKLYLVYSKQQLIENLIMISGIRKTRYSCREFTNLVFYPEKMEWIPLVFISNLLKLYSNNFPVGNLYAIKERIINSIDELKLNNGYSKSVKAVKFLDENLAKIIGAFAADGNFATRRMLRWEDEYKENLEVLSNWFKQTFDIQLKIYPSKQPKNSFITQLTNKIICRYMKVFFNFNVGNKTHSVREPITIKNSDFKIRKSFALGAMMFDGFVRFDGSVGFSVTSKKFRDDVADVFQKDKIKISVHKKSIIRKNRAKKWEFTILKPTKKILKYFEHDTKKARILNLYLYKTKIDNYSEFHSLFSHNKILNSINFFEVFKQLKTFSVYDIIKITKLSRRAANKYLNLFRTTGVLNSKIIQSKRIYWPNSESTNFSGSYSIKSSKFCPVPKNKIGFLNK